MTIKDFRIGNLVYRTIEETVYHTIVPEDFSYCIDHPENYSGISLNDEGLDRLGFIPSNQFHIKYEAPYWYMIEKSFGGDFIIKNIDFGIFVKLPIKIKYVHQLQNLYFALTGEELIPK